jgi:Tfp pilus assembly protein PilO
MPIQNRLKQIKRSREAQQIAISKGIAESKQVPALKEELEKLQETVGNFEASIPTERALGEFLHEIAELMNEYGFLEQEVQPGREIRAGAVSCIPINMQCKGTLGQIFKFFRSLQAMDRLVRIEQAELVNDSAFSGQVSMQAKAVIYYRTKAQEG